LFFGLPTDTVSELVGQRKNRFLLKCNTLDNLLGNVCCSRNNVLLHEGLIIHSLTSVACAFACLCACLVTLVCFRVCLNAATAELFDEQS